MLSVVIRMLLLYFLSIKVEITILTPDYCCLMVRSFLYLRHVSEPWADNLKNLALWSQCAMIKNLLEYEILLTDLFCFCSGAHQTR